MALTCCRALALSPLWGGALLQGYRRVEGSAQDLVARWHCPLYGETRSYRRAPTDDYYGAAFFE
jgi:hypothetical protein